MAKFWISQACVPFLYQQSKWFQWDYLLSKVLLSVSKGGQNLALKHVAKESLVGA